MTSRTAIRNALALVASLLLSATAQAQLFRAYLSSTGSDANACTLPAPCRLMPAALSAVADGGEIWMLNSANYNTATVNLTKSVSILAVPGAVGSILATGGPAIAIATDNLTIALRNLVIVPLPSTGGTSGVILTGASSLTIENSLMANLPNNAVWVVGSGTVKIANSAIRNNGGYAVRLDNGPQAEISGTQMLGNTQGGVANIGSAATVSSATVTDSVISGGLVGVAATNNIAGAINLVFVTRTTIEATGVAIDSENGGLGATLVAVSSSMITNNQVPFNQTGVGSVIRTLGNNHIADNVNPAVGTLTVTALQ